jgi:hypothetical protein
MEEIKNPQEPDQNEMKQWEEQHRRGRFVAGLFIAGAGALFLAREMGVYIPEWVFTWQMLLIAVGIMTGIKHAFRNIGWLIMVAIGVAFMVREYMPEFDFSHYLWPALIIIAGLAIMFKPKRKFYHHRWHRHMSRERCRGRYRNRYEEKYKDRYTDQYNQPASDFNEDYIEASAVFGSIKKNIISKNFRGGEINCVFGGGEVNFMQADIQQTAELEVNAVFGGARLIIPPHWEIKSEMTAVLGGVEDKRPVHTPSASQGKVLILKGNAVFGGIEIKSY